VGAERVVVFVDPGNDDEEFWRPAMVRALARRAAHRGAQRC